jgi:hypothetical protein
MNKNTYIRIIPAWFPVTMAFRETDGERGTHDGRITEAEVGVPSCPPFLRRMIVGLRQNRLSGYPSIAEILAEIYLHSCRVFTRQFYYT